MRLLEFVLPDASRGEVDELLAGLEVLDSWARPLEEGRRLLSVLVRASTAEPVMDTLRDRFGNDPGFRIVLLPVTGTVPEPPAEPPPPPATEQAAQESADAPRKLPSRVSRDELVQMLDAGARTTPLYLATVLLSSVVATVGLVRDNVAVLIGAMVIAPLLTPNMALALATTLGDPRRMRRAFLTNLAGVATGFLFALALSALFPVATTAPELIARTTASFSDIALALASGCAGALAFTSGVSASLVGVMVAVALLPPVIAAGLFAGDGDWGRAGGAFLLLATNVICVNLAAVATFAVRGVSPAAWWKRDQARRASRIALVVWSVLLVALGVAVWLLRVRP